MPAVKSAAASLMEAFKPSPALAPYVTDIWAWELPHEVQQGAAATLTLLPDGHPTMCFVYGSPLTAADGERSFTTRSAVCGFHARPMQVSCDGPARGLTVRFTPWGLAAFMPGSLAETAHRRIECRDVYGPAAVEELESQLSELPTSLARVRRVEAFLLGRLQADPADRLVQEVVATLAGRRGTTSISDMARDFGASDRTLERRFQRTVGVAPKLFSRVLRLQDAFRQREQQLSWSDLAVDAGYFDQAHLIRDAKQLFGASPRALVEQPGSEIAQGFRALGQANALAATIFR
ncbi:MAG: DUF6597 domain-containing transcriptional factor [Ramlibacter sp.]